MAGESDTITRRRWNMAGESDLDIGELLRKKYAIRQQEADVNTQDATTRAESLALRRAMLEKRSGEEAGADRRDLERDAANGVLAAKPAHLLSYDEKQALERQKTIDATRRAGEAAKREQQDRERARAEHDAARKANPYAFWREDADRLDTIANNWNQDSDTRFAALKARNDSYFNGDANDAMARRVAQAHDPGEQIMARDRAQAESMRQKLEDRIAEGAVNDPTMDDVVKQLTKQRAEGALGQLGYQRRDQGTEKERWVLMPPLPESMGGVRPAAGEGTGRVQPGVAAGQVTAGSSSPAQSRGVTVPQSAAGGQSPGGTGWRENAPSGQGVSPDNIEWLNVPQGQRVVGRGTPDAPFRYAPVATPVRQADFQKLPQPVEPGNIDLTTRPVVKNADGSISTVRSMSVNIDGKEVLIPTVSDDGRIMGDEEAVQTYLKGGRHLGKFNTPEDATAYAERLHKQQEAMYVQPRNVNTPSPSSVVPPVAGSGQNPSSEFYSPSMALGDAWRGNAVNKEAMRKTLTDTYGNVGGAIASGAANAVTGAVDVARNAPSAIWNALKPEGVEQAQANMQWAVNRPAPTGAEAEPAQWVKDAAAAAPDVLNTSLQLANPVGALGAMAWRQAGKAMSPVIDKAGAVASQIGRNFGRAVQGQPTYAEEGAGAGMNWRGEDEETRKRREAGY